MVSAMRLDRPRSAGNRVRAISASPRDEALLAEHGADLVDGRVGAGEHQLRRPEVVVGLLCPGGADARQQPLQGGAEPVLVVVVDRFEQVLVEVVQLLNARLGNLELPLAHDPDDHRWSSWAGAFRVGASAVSPAWSSGAGAGSAVSARPPSCLAVVGPLSSPLIRESSASTMASAEVRCSSASRRSLVMARLSRAPEAISSSSAPARDCICATLSSARCMAMPTSPISSPMPETASLMRVCASAAV